MLSLGFVSHNIIWIECKENFYATKQWDEMSLRKMPTLHLFIVNLVTACQPNKKYCIHKYGDEWLYRETTIYIWKSIVRWTENDSETIIN